jgi:SAM-dependent methyltransferase
MKTVTQADVQSFWEKNPLCAEAIPYEPGTREFFLYHNEMRRKEEPEDFQQRVYEYDQWARRDVLDIGCGTGYVVSLYALNGANVTGVDIAARSVELTNSRLRIFGLNGLVQQANAECLPFDNDRFDLVTSYGVLHHTPNTAAAIGEAYRVLRPNGKIIMMFYNKNSFAFRILFPLKRLFQSNWRGKTAQEQVNAVDGSGNPLGKVYSKADLRKLLINFDNLEFSTGNIFFAWAHLLGPWASKFIASRFGWHLYVKGTKK